MRLPFGEWLPDQPDYENSGSNEITNALPDGDGYKSIGALTSISDAFTSYCRGAYSTRDSNDVVYNFAGDENSLKLLSGAVSSTWTDVSRSTGYNLGLRSYWDFTRIGDRVIAVGRQNGKPQYYDLGVSSTFENLTGSPDSKVVGIVREFLVVGDTTDTTDGHMPNRVRWAGIGTTESWDVSATTQADYQDLQREYGRVHAITEGEVGYIFQERAITRMSYVGTPSIFQFDVVEVNRGTQASRSVVQIGSLVYYLGSDGFYVFDGAASTPIGNMRVDATFLADFDADYAHRVIAVADREQKLIYWAYPSKTATDGTPDKILVFNYADGEQSRWTRIEQDVEILWDALTPDMTVEELDTIDASLDGLSGTLDIGIYIGGSPFVGAFNTDHEAATFTGSPMTAVMTTTEQGQTDRGVITRARPVLEGTESVTVAIGTRDSLADLVTWTSEVSPVSNGTFPVRANGRYVRARLTVTGRFTNGKGVDVEEYTGGGKR